LGSLAIALDFLNQQKQHNKKTVILSDILQSGKNEKNLYTEVADLLSKKKYNISHWNWLCDFKPGRAFQNAKKFL
jgi:hypothetical protein